jgi:predicted nucleic acid-binding protein
MKYRIVLDTNQIIEAGSKWVDPLEDVSSSPARKLLRTVAKHHTGLYCSKIMAEYVEKLLDRNNPPDRVANLISILMGVFEEVKLVSTSCPKAPSDEDDIVFILCSIDGNADMLVSSDRHILDLKDHYQKPEILGQADAHSRLGIS